MISPEDVEAIATASLDVFLQTVDELVLKAQQEGRGFAGRKAVMDGIEREVARNAKATRLHSLMTTGDPDLLSQVWVAMIRLARHRSDN